MDFSAHKFWCHGEIAMEITTSTFFAEQSGFANMDISMSGVVSTDEEWVQEPLYAPFSRLYCVTGGRGFLTSSDGNIEMKPGNVYFAPCGKKYGYYSTPSVTKLFFHINIKVSEGHGDAFQNCVDFGWLPYPVVGTQKLIESYLLDDPGELMILKSEIFGTVCRFYRLLAGKNSHKKTFSDAVVKSKSFIMSNLNAGIRVSDVARAALCSESKLCRLFKDEVGQSVTKYIDEMLMSKAKTLLTYSELSIGEISDSLGFCDQFYFSRKFSAETGLTPREFRRIRMRQI